MLKYCLEAGFQNSNYYKSYRVDIELAMKQCVKCIRHLYCLIDHFSMKRMGLKSESVLYGPRIAD